MKEANKKDKKSFPNLPLLDDLTALIGSQLRAADLEKTLIVGCQHLLESTGSLVESIIEIGVPPNQIILCGKSYSTNEKVAQSLLTLGVNIIHPDLTMAPGDFSKGFDDDIKRMWDVAKRLIMELSLNQIIILDDGARSISMMPEALQRLCKIGAVEQTTFGVREASESQRKVSTILVAASAAKKTLESPMIADAITRKLEKYSFLLGQKRRCGIFGLGAIGTAVSTKLLEMGHIVQSYDSKDASHSVNDPTSLILQSDIIFGCTGLDLSDYFFKIDKISSSKSQKILISCSSEDKEFRTLIQKHGQNLKALRFYDDVLVNYKDSQFLVLNGGLPINFDRSPTSVPNHEIQLTRTLLLAGIFQAFGEMVALKTPTKKLLMLSPQLQQRIAKSYANISKVKFEENKIKIFTNIADIIGHSGGAYLGPLPNLMENVTAFTRNPLSKI